MTVPLIILAALSLVGGYINIPRFLEPIFPAAEGKGDEWLVYVSVAAGVLGIALAYLFYVAAPKLADSVANVFYGFYKLIYNKYFVDELYEATVVRPVVDGSRAMLWRGVDVQVIDGMVNGIGRRARGIGGVLKLSQSGYIRSYAAWVVAGSIVLILIAGLAGEWR